MMQLSLIIHLPGILLETTGAALGPGYLTCLPFEEWQRLDPILPYTVSKYEKARPTFWIGELPIENGASQAEILQLNSELLWKLHMAFLLEPRVPWLPSPLLSVQYLTIKGHPIFSEIVENLTLRLIGPAEREWIVFGSPVSVPYDAPALAHVALEFAGLAQFDLNHAFSGVSAGIAVLERTARPDSWWGSNEYLYSINDFVHCIAACEGILLADDSVEANNTITETFGRQSAVVTARTQDQLTPFAKHWSNLYRLRSRLVHGRIGLTELDDVQCGYLPQARSLLRAIIKAAIVLRIEANSDDILPSLLAQAFADPAVYTVVRQRLEEKL